MATLRAPRRPSAQRGDLSPAPRGRGARLAIGFWLFAGVARGQTRLDPVEVVAPRSEAEAARQALDETLAVTVVTPPPASARTVSVAEVLEREAGVLVRSQGGLGAFSAVSIRGSEAGEVQVLLDGVPLSRAFAAAVDLSRLPVAGIARIEVYRGAAPIDLGSPAVGGVIHLISRPATRRLRLQAAFGGGAFAGDGARSAMLRGSGPLGRLAASATAAYHGASGDFVYRDHQTTLLDPGDDLELRRRNNDFDQLSLDATLRRDGATRLTLATQAFWKRQGVPGPARDGAASRTARLETGRVVVRGSLERARLVDPSLDGRIDAYALFERASFQNLAGEGVGSFFPARTISDALAAGATVRARAAAGRHELWTFVGSLEVEHYRPRDLLRPETPTSPSTRIRAALAVGDEIRLAGDRLALSPALRLDGILSDLAAGLAVAGEGTAAKSHDDVFVSPRLTVALRATPRLTFRGSVGRFARLPTTVELFGDGAFVLPRPGLRAESALAGDLGARLDLARGRFALLVDLTLFGRRVDDYIALVPAGRALAAINLPGTRQLLGAEAHLELRAGPARATFDYTFIDARNASEGFVADAAGKELPTVPRHRAALRLQLELGPLTAFYDLIATAASFRDPQNTDGNIIPARALHALGASFGPLPELPLALGLEIQNLADQRTVELPLGGTIHGGRTVPYPLIDQYDYPLPGRAVFATLTLTR